MSQPTVATVKRLFALSSNRCAFPKCANAIVDPSGKVTGRICHIKGRRPGGPRFDPSQSDPERHSFENLLLLCPIHHDVVDADSDSYTVDRLLAMKNAHEWDQTRVPEPPERVVAALIGNIDAAPGSAHTVVISQHQSGGITAGTVNIDAAPKPGLHMREVFANRATNNEYHTRLELEVDSPYPAGNLSLVVRSASMKRIDLVPQRSGAVIFGHSGTRAGMAFTNLQSPYGRMFLEIFTAHSDTFEIEWDLQ